LSKTDIPVFVLCNDDVEINGKAVRIDVNDNCFFGDIGNYMPNTSLNGALFKLLIPYIDCIKKYEKALYLDLDVVLKDGWERIFETEQSKPILATKDVGITESFLRLNRLEKFYIGRKFEYCNSGVMLFDFSKWNIGIDEMKSFIEKSIENSWVYADQDIINASNIADCTLDAKFNTFRKHADSKTITVHYTAELNAKDMFDKYIESVKNTK